MNIYSAYIITFIASFCILVIEIVAGRILAPFVGVSLYTWTSIIGVVLAGISIGAYLGGRLADRFPDVRTLVWLLIISGMAVLLIAPVTNLIAAYKFQTSLMMRILIVTSLIFFIPSCILGMISPVIIRLALRKMERVGHIVGKIYAISTLGSIIGTFAAGFFLISWIGTRQIMLLMGGILMLTGIAYGTLAGKRRMMFGVVALPALLAGGYYDYACKPLLDKDVLMYKESDYYTIKVKEATRKGGHRVLKSLVLDHLTHSFVDTSDPLHLEYEYELIYADILKWRLTKDAQFMTLSIGGGGYAFPRYMEAYYPQSYNEVVEIDPQITKIAYDHLALPRETRIRTFNEDGRWFVMNCRNKYDVVFIDAYNDLSIPYHLTTKEFAEQIKSITKPDGIVLTNVIDNFQQGSFLPSYIRTLREVFGKDNVHLISISPDFERTRISTFIVLTGNSSVDIRSFAAFLAKEGRATSSVVPDVMVNAYVDRNYSVLLTDDYAPVDNLIAPIFETRFGYSGAR
ncbi:MAG TPA: fused MFS/spermidine synthase [Dissulfurispiraceae bacterium]|nr:fused MFS/spermidine synthase [Dissulfurispiraceae bacterium]